MSDKTTAALAAEQADTEATTTQEAELLHRLDPARHPKPAGSAQAGQFRGIAISAAR